MGFLTTLLALVLSVTYVQAAIEQDPVDSNVDDFNDALNIVTLDNFVVYFTGDPEDKTPGRAGGAIGVVNGWVSMTYEESSLVSANSYVATTLEDAGFVQPAYAQTPGFAMLNPAITMWEVTRFFALTFLVVVSVILSFMILLRVREGQGYVTIVNAYPKIILALAAIWFSFGMAGLMMDLVNLGSNLVLYSTVEQTNLFDDFVGVNSFPTSTGSTLEGKYSRNVPGQEGVEHLTEQDINTCVSEGLCPDYNVFRLMSHMVSFSHWGTRPCGADETPDVGSECSLRIRDIINTPTHIGLIDGTIDFAGGKGSELVIEFIVAVMLIMIVFKVFIALLMAFLQILLRTIFAPIQFLLIPIQGPAVIWDWAKNMLTNVLVFPVTLLLIVISAVFSHITAAPFFVDAQALEDFNTAPLLLLHSLGANDSASVNPALSFLGKALGVAMLALIPQVPNILKEAMQIRSSAAIQQVGATFKSAASKVPVVGGAISGLAG